MPRPPRHWRCVETRMYATAEFMTSSPICDYVNQGQGD
jgi:hypothetical protein